MELMITLLILTGLFFVMLPLGQRFFNKNALEERVNYIVSAIKFAKNKVQLEGKSLVLSELSDEDGWINGMRLFIDNTGNYHFEPGDTKIREWRWNDKVAKVAWHGFRSDHYLLFNPNIKKASINGYFSLVENNQVKRKIIINRLGRIRVEK